jgi:hypothetical protein
MHGQGNGGPPVRLPDPSSLEYTAQRLVLLELVIDPPAGVIDSRIYAKRSAWLT